MGIRRIIPFVNSIAVSVIAVALSVIAVALCIIAFDRRDPYKRHPLAFRKSTEAGAERRLSEVDCSCWGSEWHAADDRGGVVICEVTASIGSMPPCGMYATASELATLTSTVSALSSCESGGRRLENEETNATAQKVVQDYLSSHPQLARSLTSDQLASLQELGQHFGLPAHA
jgi:hypothetical protein